MIDGCQRSALTAGLDICRAEIVDDLGSENIGHQLAVAELSGVAQAIPGWSAMQHGLPMKTDSTDVLHGQSGAFDKLLNGGGLGARQRFFRILENQRFRTFKIPASRLTQCFFEQKASIFRIGRKRVGAEGFDAFAVRLDERDIDIAVEYRSGHQSDRPDRLHCLSPIAIDRIRSFYTHSSGKRRRLFL
ncbi:hypothetical protein D3C73_983630 [compost metagenome]